MRTPNGNQPAPTQHNTQPADRRCIQLNQDRELVDDQRLPASRLVPSNIRVSALHVAYMNTDMVKGFDLPKVDSATIASLTLDGTAADEYEPL